MALSVSFTVLRGLAFAPSDITWGDAQSVSVDIDNNGALLQAGFARPSLQANARGIDSNTVSGIFNESKANRSSLILGNSPSTETIDISGRSMSGFISKVEPSGEIIIEGTAIVESCRITWEGLNFE